MTIKTLKDIEDLGFIIEEVINNVTEISSVELSQWANVRAILNSKHRTYDAYKNYDSAFVRYQVIKDDTVITELLNKNELVIFFERGDYKKYLKDKKTVEKED